MNLDGCKATPKGDVSVNNLKSTVDIYALYITSIINLSVEEGHIPNELKPLEVSPIFKKKDDFGKENYRPPSVLLHV